MNIRTMIAGSGLGEDTRLEYLLEETEIEIKGRITDISAGIDAMDREKPDLVLITGAYDRKMQMFCQQVYILYPMCVMVLLAKEANQALYSQAMEDGIRRLIAPIPERNLLVDSLKEIFINEQARQENITGDGGSRLKTEVLFIFGAKGGTGKTALAVNLATKLAMSKKKVILLDCDLLFGDTGLFLGMEPKETLSELLQEQRNPTLDTVNNFLAFHQSGLKVLFGPKSPEFAEIIGGKSVEKIVSILRNYYDYIIIDSAVGFTEINLTLLDFCSRILLVTQSDLCTLQNTKKAFLVLKSLNMEQKIKLIMLESGGSSIGKADVERVLGNKVDMIIPYDEKTMTSCLNQGRPVVLAAPKSRLAEEYGKITGMVERNFTTTKSQRRFFASEKQKTGRR